MKDNILKHWGIKGMRWGIRRYQNPDGSLTPAGRKRYADQDAEDQQSAEEMKKRAINSGDLDAVKKYRGSMTNDELRKALDRVDLEQRISKTDSSINKSGFEKTMSVIDTVDKVRGAGEKLFNAYGLIAKVNNTFNNRFKLTEPDSRAKTMVDEFKDRLVNTASAQEVADNLHILNAKEKLTANSRLDVEDKLRQKAAKS